MPIPVLVLALIGALTLFSVVAGRSRQLTGPAVQADPRSQVTERQPAGLTYFRIMNWLVGVLPSEPAKPAAAPAAVPSAGLRNAPGRGHAARAQLCAFEQEAGG